MRVASRGLDASAAPSAASVYGSMVMPASRAAAIAAAGSATPVDRALSSTMAAASAAAWRQAVVEVGKTRNDAALRNTVALRKEARRAARLGTEPPAADTSAASAAALRGPRPGTNWSRWAARSEEAARLRSQPREETTSTMARSAARWHRARGRSLWNSCSGSARTSLEMAATPRSWASLAPPAVPRSSQRRAISAAGLMARRPRLSAASWPTGSSLFSRRAAGERARTLATESSTKATMKEPGPTMRGRPTFPKASGSRASMATWRGKRERHTPLASQRATTWARASRPDPVPSSVERRPRTEL
mmetsp:Transcript_18858/g.71884  ORF Transcript_18858/g.71884 Transcript_18858/m.71884 type:complete len:306 (+) Transcript_18858:1717-2634(+)